MLGYVGVGLLFVYGTEHAQRAEIHETLYGHVQCEHSLHQMARAFGVHPVEVGLVQTLRHACRMYDVVELVAVELLLEPFFGVEVKLYEVDSRVLQITL